MPAPRGALATSVRAQKCGMVMSEAAQIIFPYLSCVLCPPVAIQMAAQVAYMGQSFWVFLSSLLNKDDV